MQARIKPEFEDDFESEPEIATSLYTISLADLQ